MNILFVNESLGGGGAERQLSLIANEFSARGHAVSLATWASRETRDAYPLVPGVHRFHLRRREATNGRLASFARNARSFARLLGLIRRLEPAVIVSFSETSNILTTLAGKIVRRPTAVSLRTNPDEIFRLKPHWRRPAIWAYRHADAVIVQTTAVAQWCQDHCRRSATIVPNILRSLPARIPDVDRESLIVSVGSLIHYKGHDVLIRAFAAANARHPRWRLAILGEGPERAALGALAEKLGVADKVQLRGFSSTVEDDLNRARIFAFPSRFEGFPNALAEAMGMGLACVASDCAFGPSELINDGANGLLVPVDDVHALSAALDRLMGDAALRTSMGSRAVAINGRYTPDRIVGLWNEILSRVGQGTA